MRPAAGLLALVPLGLLLSACGSASAPRTPAIDEISGKQVAGMAERRLEAENPGVAPGRITCGDLAFEVGASVRCTRVAELSGGRQVRLFATVAVTSLADGGRLHVRTDEKVAEFGVTAAAVRTGVARWVRERTGRSATADCPYVAGVRGTTVRCEVRTGGRQRQVEVRVTSVDPATFLTRYACRWVGEG